MKGNQKNVINKIKSSLSSIANNLLQYKSKTFKYRVCSVEQDKNGDYIATIQTINSKNFFKLKPEEILADDHLTDCFSQRDIRALTYLGYLGVNSPKYKILAQRFLENNQKLIFAIQEKGKKKPIIKAADELSSDEKFIKNLSQKDAHLVGYTTGSESGISEKSQMEQLLKENKNNKLSKEDKDKK